MCCAGTDAEQSGEVLRLCDKDNDNSVSYQHTVYMLLFFTHLCGAMYLWCFILFSSQRGYVEVDWSSSDQTTVHRVGHGGKVKPAWTY